MSVLGVVAAVAILAGGVLIGWSIGFGRANKVVGAYDAIAQLHTFIVEELDPDPHPVEAYVTGTAATRAAKLAVPAALEGDALRDERTRLADGSVVTRSLRTEDALHVQFGPPVSLDSGDDA